MLVRFDIAAVIITYNPNILDLEKLLESIESQVQDIVIIDNCSENINLVKKLIEKFTAIHLMCNESNLGVAIALNQGIEFVSKKGYKWVLTLDQDSLCENNLIEELRKYIGCNVGLIGPHVEYRNIKDQSEVVMKLNCHDVDFCITSGSLMNIEAWDEIGRFNEDFFIDWVDIEYCYRLKKYGFSVLQCESTVLKQQLGRPKKIWWLRKEISIHDPLRWYYITRNRNYFIKNQLGNDGREKLLLLKTVFVNIVIADEKLATMRYVVKGFHDFKHSYIGEIDE